MTTESLKQLVAQYEEAREWDARCHEADNSGNAAGDALADGVRAFLADVHDE